MGQRRCSTSGRAAALEPAYVSGPSAAKWTKRIPEQLLVTAGQVHRTEESNEVRQAERKNGEEKVVAKVRACFSSAKKVKMDVNLIYRNHHITAPKFIIV